MATKAIVRYRHIPRAKHHRRHGMTLPVAVLAGFAPLGFGLLHAAQRGIAGDMDGAKQEVVIRTTGYNTDTGNWNGAAFMGTYGPILAGVVVHKIASRLGINRAIAKAGVPLLRI